MYSSCVALSSKATLTLICVVRYWCTKCKKRFSSQAKLVDHMSYSVEHNYQKDAAEKKRKTSQGSVGSSQPSPASSVDSLGSSPSPGSVSPFNDIMSVLSPT